MSRHPQARTWAGLAAAALFVSGLTACSDSYAAPMHTPGSTHSMPKAPQPGYRRVTSDALKVVFDVPRSWAEYDGAELRRLPAKLPPQLQAQARRTGVTAGVLARQLSRDVEVHVAGPVKSGYAENVSIVRGSMQALDPAEEFAAAIDALRARPAGAYAEVDTELGATPVQCWGSTRTKVYGCLIGVPRGAGEWGTILLKSGTEAGRDKLKAQVLKTLDAI